MTQHEASRRDLGCAQAADLPLWKPMLIYLAAFPFGLACGSWVGDMWKRLIALFAGYCGPLLYWTLVLRARRSSLSKLLGVGHHWGLKRWEPLALILVASTACFGARLAWWTVLLHWDAFPDTGSDRGPLSFWVTAGIASSVGPLMEEVLFRCILFDRLRRRLGAAHAAVLSSALFGLLHLDPVGTVALSLCLAGVYLVTKTLWAPVLAHSAYNLVGTVVACVSLFPWLVAHVHVVAVVSIPCAAWIVFFLCRALREGQALENREPAAQ